MVGWQNGKKWLKNNKKGQRNILKRLVKQRNGRVTKTGNTNVIATKLQTSESSVF